MMLGKARNEWNETLTTLTCVGNQDNADQIMAISIFNARIKAIRMIRSTHIFDIVTSHVWIYSIPIDLSDNHATISLITT